MSAIEFDVEISLSGVKMKLGEEGVRRAQLMLVDRVATDSQKFVPVASGDLYRSMSKGRDEVTWQMYYASHAYYSKHIIYGKENQYGTDPHDQWFEVAKDRYLKDWEKVAAGAFLK